MLHVPWPQAHSTTQLPAQQQHPAVLFPGSAGRKLPRAGSRRGGLGTATCKLTLLPAAAQPMRCSIPPHGPTGAQRPTLQHLCPNAAPTPIPPQLESL